MVSAIDVKPPLHHPILFRSPSHSWSTPVEREGTGGGDSSDLRAQSDDMTSSMEVNVGYTGNRRFMWIWWHIGW